MPDVQLQRYHQRTWLKEFGHAQPHVYAAQWTHAEDKRDLDAIQALAEHGEQRGEQLTVWPTFPGTDGYVRLGDWVLKDDHGNVFVMYDAHFQDRFGECHDVDH